MAHAVQPVKYLIAIGYDKWVDPMEVIAIDADFDGEAPNWANVRILLSTGHTRYGERLAGPVAQAVRHPERDNVAEEADAAYPDGQAGAVERARRRHQQQQQSPLRRVGPPDPEEET